MAEETNTSAASQDGGAPPPSPTETPFNSMASKLTSLLGQFDGEGKKKPDAPTPTPAAAPAPAPTPAPASVVPADDGVPDIIKSPKAAAEFRTIKAARDEWKQKYEELSGKSPTQVVPPDYDKVKEEHAQMRESLRLLDIEREPTFVKRFQEPISLTVAQMKKAVGTANAEKAEKIMLAPESDQRTSELEDLMDDLSPLQQGRFAAALSDYDSIMARRSSEVAKAKEDYGKVTQSLQADRQAAVDRGLKQAQDAVDRVLQHADVLDAFKGADDPTKTKGIEERREFVRSFAKGTLPEEVYPWVPALAAEAMFLRETRLPELQKKVEILEAQLAEIRNASPSPGATSGAKEGGGAPKAADSFISTFQKHWHGE